MQRVNSALLSPFTVLKYTYIIYFDSGGISMNNKLKSKTVDMLFEGILKLETVEECYNFFEDLCTIHEINSI